MKSKPLSDEEIEKLRYGINTFPEFASGGRLLATIDELKSRVRDLERRLNDANEAIQILGLMRVHKEE